MNFVKNQLVMFFDGENWREAKFVRALPAFGDAMLVSKNVQTAGGLQFEYVPLTSVMTFEEYQNPSTTGRDEKEGQMKERIKEREERNKKRAEAEALKPIPIRREKQKEDFDEIHDRYMIYKFLFWALLGLILLYELQKHYHMFRGDDD